MGLSCFVFEIWKWDGRRTTDNGPTTSTIAYLVLGGPAKWSQAQQTWFRVSRCCHLANWWHDPTAISRLLCTFPNDVFQTTVAVQKNIEFYFRSWLFVCRGLMDWRDLFERVEIVGMKHLMFSTDVLDRR